MTCAVIPAEGVSLRAGTQDNEPRAGALTLDPGYFAAAKFRDDNSRRARLP
jgi:hypothetical protein